MHTLHAYVHAFPRPAAASTVLGKQNSVHPSEQPEDHQAELMKDGRATHLGNGDSLLLHGFMDCHTVIFPHLHWKDMSIRTLTQTVESGRRITRNCYHSIVQTLGQSANCRQSHELGFHSLQFPEYLREVKQLILSYPRIMGTRTHTSLSEVVCASTPEAIPQSCN